MPLPGRPSPSVAPGAWCMRPTGLSPYFLEGTKTFAYEIARQLANDPPVHIVLPVGNGSLLIGAWKGFCELSDAARVTEMPRLHCVQATAVMPIVAAYDGVSWAPQPGAKTVANGISVAEPPRHHTGPGRAGSNRGGGAGRGR